MPPRPISRKLVDRVAGGRAAGEVADEAGEREHHAEGDDEARHPEQRRRQPVDQPDPDADHQHQQDAPAGSGPRPRRSGCRPSRPASVTTAPIERSNSPETITKYWPIAAIAIGAVRPRKRMITPGSPKLGLATMIATSRPTRARRPRRRGWRRRRRRGSRPRAAGGRGSGRAASGSSTVGGHRASWRAASRSVGARTGRAPVDLAAGVDGDRERRSPGRGRRPGGTESTSIDAHHVVHHREDRDAAEGAERCCPCRRPAGCRRGRPRRSTSGRSRPGSRSSGCRR